MKIVCFGDSNTYGYDPRSIFGDRYTAQYRWVDLIAEKLDCNVINAGENGREITTRDLPELERMLHGQDPANFLIIMLGTNDLLQNNSIEVVRDRMEEFLNHIPLETKKILLIAPPSLQCGYWVADQNLIQASKDLALKYQRLAADRNVHFANAGDWNITLAFDGVHFTEDGNIAFAKGICTYLNERGLLSFKRSSKQ